MNTKSYSRINRIDYIVKENPNGVYHTLIDEGFSPSNNIDVLIHQTKQWIHSDGKSAIIKLLKVHPEKEAILSANKEAFDNNGGCACSNSFDGSACGCKSSFDGSTFPCKSSYDGSGCPCQSKGSFSPELNEQLEQMSKKELREHYERLKRLLQKFPDDEELRCEVEEVWEHLNYRKKKKSKVEQEKSEQKEKQAEGSKTVFSVNSKDLAVGSLILGLGLIISQIR